MPFRSPIVAAAAVLPDADARALADDRFDVAIAESTEAHDEAVSSWARLVWQAWREHHAAVAAMAAGAGHTN
jgi:hypothetical protein